MSRYSHNTIRRREFLMTVGAVGGSAGLAGCFGITNGDGDPVVQQTVGEQKTFEFEAEEGDNINIYLEKREGQFGVATLRAPLAGRVAMEEIESETTISHSAQDGGLFLLEVFPAGSNAEVYVEVSVES